MNNIKGFVQFITESQVFPFEEYKPQIIDIISRIKSGENISFLDRNYIYSIVTNSTAKVGNAKKFGFTDESSKNWKTFFTSDYWNSNGVWSQKDLNPQFKRKLGPDKTLNYYITIVKEKSNIQKFGQSLHDLTKRLYELSSKTKSPISYKTHTLLDVFVTHNDSLKVYYYDSDLKDDIERVVNEWIKSNGLKVSDRTHYHGADVKSSSGEKESWGQILTNLVLDELEKVVKQHGNKYSDDEYFQWFKQWMPGFIKKVQIKYK